MAERGNIVQVNEPLNYFRRSLKTVTSRREADGSNSNARLIILNYIFGKGYIPKYRVYNAHIKELRDIDYVHGMSDETKAALRQKWTLTPRQYKIHKFIYSVLNPYYKLIRILGTVTNFNKLKFRYWTNKLIKKGNWSIAQFCEMYYNLEK